MTIKVLFFASLREKLGQSQVELPFQAGLTPALVWQQITQTPAPTGHVLVACNQHYCALDTPLADGAELAFFPPVTGG